MGTTVTEKDKKSSLALPFSNEGQIRMKKTLREMFSAVSLGALTTLIGVAPIAAAQFPYFRQYYFKLYVMIVLFGWLNGVIFQLTILLLLSPFIPSSSSQSVTVSTETKLQNEVEMAADVETATATTDAGKHTRDDADSP